MIIKQCTFRIARILGLLVSFTISYLYILL